MNLSLTVTDAPPSPVASSAHIELAGTKAVFIPATSENSGNSSGIENGKCSGGRNYTETQSVKRARTSAGKSARTRDTKPDFYVDVSESDLLDLIRNYRVKVERSGSLRRNKDGTLRDYRGKYIALRERSKARRVLAFGTAEKMSEYLANRLNVYFCQNCLTVSIDTCRKCSG